jgi:hypothetical protein
VGLFCKLSSFLVAFCVLAAIIKKQKRGETKMDKDKFNQLFTVLVRETGVENNNSATNIDDYYDTYLDLLQQLDKNDDSLEYMARMVTMNSKERLEWRRCLAEEGIEMTPSQVDEYVVILELAISAP